MECNKVVTINNKRRTCIMTEPKKTSLARKLDTKYPKDHRFEHSIFMQKLKSELRAYHFMIPAKAGLTLTQPELSSSIQSELAHSHKTRTIFQYPNHYTFQRAVLTTEDTKHANPNSKSLQLLLLLHTTTKPNTSKKNSNPPKKSNFDHIRHGANDPHRF